MTSRHVRRRVVVVIAACTLGACASPPLAWHTLVKPARGQPDPAAPAQRASSSQRDTDAPSHPDDVRRGAATSRPGAPPGANHVFEFVTPGVPAQVDRAELVLADDATRRVRVLEGERWLASLPEEVRAALARGYARASGAREAAGLPRPQGVPALRVRTMVRRFEIGAGRATIDAEWSLELAGEAARGAPLCAWSGSAPTRGTSTPAGDVNAMQDLLDALAATIAAMGSRWIADPATPCPAVPGAVSSAR